MEEQFNREAKEGWRFAADAARITEETACSEDRKHTPGGVFVAVDSNLRAVVGANEGAIESNPGNEGSFAQAWANVRGGLRVSPYLLHSEGWTPRNEALLQAVLKQARTTRHPWLLAWDANMCPEDFEKSLWFQREQMPVVATNEASTCRSAQMVSGSKEAMLTSLRGAVSKEKCHRWRWWKTLSRDHTKPCPSVVVKEGEVAKSVSWSQWRRVAREKRKGKRQRRRGGRKGQQRGTSKV